MDEDRPPGKAPGFPGENSIKYKDSEVKTYVCLLLKEVFCHLLQLGRNDVMKTRVSVPIFQINKNTSQQYLKNTTLEKETSLEQQTYTFNGWDPIQLCSET